MPGQANVVVPLLCKPFSGEHNTATFFDHDLPAYLDDQDESHLTLVGADARGQRAGRKLGCAWIA
jgi:hypothetical protein